MPERACAAVHVHLVERQTVLFHRRHGDHGEGFVDLVEVHLARAPPGALKVFLDGAEGAVVDHAGS